LGFCNNNKKRVQVREPRTSRPPGAPPPGPGPLGAWGAEGLPSTRNWPFRWPLPPTSPPQVIPKAQGNVSRQLDGAVVGGGGVELHQRRHSRAAGASVLLPFDWLRKPRGRCPGRAGLPQKPEGLTGMAGIRRVFPGGPAKAKPLLHRASFLVSKRIAARR
jgi:hypothetical protein